MGCRFSAFVRLVRCVVLTALVGAFVFSAHARLDLVTLPDRDAVQLTVYNSADLTMVQETRVLTFRKGINRLTFSWANTLIDPTSLEFHALTHADEVEVLDMSFPPGVTNALDWRIQSEFAGEAAVEIRYFTSGISWAADYLAEAAPDEQTMALGCYVRVTNNSGEDYENAQIRLVVGTIHLVDKIIDLARQGHAVTLPAGQIFGREEKLNFYYLFTNRVQAGLGGGYGGGGYGGKPAEIVKEGLSEYFLYTVEGRDTIPNGWSKRLPSFHTQDVPIQSYYKFEKERWGDRVIRFYKFKNDEASHLGKEPLPDGEVAAFRVTGPDQRYDYVGRTHVQYIPVDEQVELELGNDQEVRVEPKLMNWVKNALDFDRNGNVIGWTIVETWEVQLQNSKRIPVTIDLRRNFPGDWSLQTEAKYEKVDANKVKFLIPLQPGEKQTLRYELTSRSGTNVSR